MNLIYLVSKNADMTEGRGPMVPVSAYAILDEAKAFVETQSGVMGRQTNKWKYTERRVYPAKTINGVTFPEQIQNAYWELNDHHVEEMCLCSKLYKEHYGLH